MKKSLSFILIIAGSLIGGGVLLFPERINACLDTKISVSDGPSVSAFATLNGQSRQDVDDQKFSVRADRFNIKAKLPFIITLADLFPEGTDIRNFSLTSVTLLCRDDNNIKPEDEKNKLTLEINGSQSMSDLGTTNFLKAQFGTIFFPFTQPIDLSKVKELVCVLPYNTGLSVFQPTENAKLLGNESISYDKIWYPIVRLHGTVPSPLAPLRIPLMVVGALLFLVGAGTLFSSRKKVQSIVGVQSTESVYAYNAQELYIQFDDIISGPFTTEDLSQMLEQKQITDKTPVCSPLDQSWSQIEKRLKK